MWRLTYGQSLVDIVDNVKYIVDSVKNIPRLRLSATKGGLGIMDRPFGQTRPGRRSFCATEALVAAVVALALGPAPAQDPLLWGSLKPGPNAVGYRNLYRLDHTRQYDPEFVTDPRRLPAHKPRPIYIAVWYPAQKTDAKPMEYRQYLDASSDNPLITPFAKRLAR